MWCTGRDILQNPTRALTATDNQHTPLMWIDKAATWAMARGLGGAALEDLILEHTHSCYRGDRTRRHPWGYGCDACPACDLRRSGWERYSAGGV